MRRLTKISALHYAKLCVRSLLFVGALLLYVFGRLSGEAAPLAFLGSSPAFLIPVTALFVVEMALRFFPSPLESMGCQKQFARNYIPRHEGVGHVHLGTQRSTLAVLGTWVLLNGAIGVLYFTGVLDAGVLLLISLFYAVADMICILFFCPFQTWFMKNKCCGACRIYNWDYAMMFTPLLFLLPNPFAIILCGLSLLLLLFWEISALRHPERFSPMANGALSCANCKEKLCHHKRQLRSFLRKNAVRVQLVERFGALSTRARELIKQKKRKK